MPARLFFLLACLCLCSCSNLERLAKAGAPKPTSFLEHAGELKKTNPEKSPFLLEWRNPSSEVLRLAQASKTLYIAPVSLNELRPMSQTLSKVEIREAARLKEARKLADLTREEFKKAFQESKTSRFTLVDTPAPDSLIVELALTEVNPNPLSGGVTRTAISIIAIPGLDSLIAKPLKGSITIEGRLRDAKQAQSLYEFADAEQNRSALIISVHDFTPYSHFRKVIREWATQFEQITRTPADGSVRDSSAFTLWLW